MSHPIFASLFSTVVPTPARRTLRPALFAVALSSMALGGATCGMDGEEPGGDAGPVDEGPTEVCSEAVEPSCQDESIQDLPLRDTVADADIVNEDDGDGFISTVDATAGGFGGDGPYVYARFTDDGLETVDVSDLDALESMDWDIAFRRFIIRLNSGVSGPSCVTAGRTAGGTTFDDVTEVPDGVTFRAEEYYTETCEFVPDGSGLGSAGVVLQNYWEYPGCVRMTGNVYIIELASGRHVKAEVLAYYNEAAQQECQDMGSTVTSPSGSANLRVRWSFLD